MNVSLTPKLEELIRGKVDSGYYSNASEVVREALRLLFERDQTATRGHRNPPERQSVLGRLAALEQPLRQRGVSGLALFGSLARDQARPGSDIDLLVDIDPDAHLSLIDLISLKNFLEGQIGHPVDITTRDGLEPAIRDSVLEESERVF